MEKLVNGTLDTFVALPDYAPDIPRYYDNITLGENLRKYYTYYPRSIDPSYTIHIYKYGDLEFTLEYDDVGNTEMPNPYICYID